MNQSSTSRLPYEIWEYILLEVIAIPSPPVFDVVCTSSNYRAFKQTSGDGVSAPPLKQYKASEKDRQTMRFVCRSWRDFAERWDVRERWIRILSLYQVEEVSKKRWKGAQRIEFYTSIGAGLLETAGSRTASSNLCAALLSWKSPGDLSERSSQGGMRLRRLEMIGDLGPHFEEVFNTLCDASASLGHLRSLVICIPGRDGNPLRRLSRHFPNLTHLTLRAYSPRPIPTEAGEEGGPDMYDPSFDALVLQRLEVLFLIPAHDFSTVSHLNIFKLSTWSLPCLRHFYVRGLRASHVWKAKILPFLERHAMTIESLDLDNSDPSLGGWHAYTFDPDTVDFWKTFPRLKFLQCDLSPGGFKTYPPQHHPIEVVFNIGSVDSRQGFVNLVRPWVEGTGNVKRLKQLALYGSFFSSKRYKRGRESVLEMLETLQSQGIKLTNFDERPWL